MNRSTLVFCVLAVLLGSAFGHGSDRVSKGRVASVCAKNACVIEPEVTEGPYYYDTEYVREDITEGMPGIQLNLTVTVLDIATCSPITKAAIDIWHCDASGVYSWFVNDQNPAPANSTFLRGIVLTDSYGAATFKTIYPGWYVGRATHIHVKVHINGTDDNGLYSGGSVSLTSQFFFDDSINDQIYENELYSGEPTSVSRVLNSQDSIYNEMNGMGMLDITMMDPSQGYAGGVYGKITIVVDTTASSTGGSTGSGGSSPQPSGQPARPSGNPPSGVPPPPSSNGGHGATANGVPSGQPARPSGNPPSGHPPRPSGAPSGVPPPNGTVPSGQPPRPSGNPPSGHPPRPSGAPSGVPPPPPSGAPSNNDSVIVGESKSSPSQKPPQPSGAPSRVPPPPANNTVPSGQPAQPSGNPPSGQPPRPSGAPSGVPPPPNGTVPSGQPPRPSGNPPSGQPPRPSGGASSGVPPPPPSGAPESSPASDADSESENLIQLSNPEVASSASVLRHVVELLPTLVMFVLFF